MPVLILLYLLFQEGLRTFVLLFSGSSRVLRVGVTVAVLVGGVLCMSQTEQRVLQLLEMRRWPHSRKAHDDQLRAVGEWLHDHTPPSVLIATSSIGALPYYADRPLLDMMGLTDKHIGHVKIAAMGSGAAGHEKGDGQYVLERKPDIILFDKGHLFPKEVSLDEVLAGARGVSELDIAHTTEFLHGYELRRTPMKAGVLHWFVRRDSPAVQPDHR
jgi:hypothetical protein